MICPNCKQDMIVVERQRIELDFCPNCEGVWFDAGELDLLLHLAHLQSPELVISNIANLPEVPASHRLLKCPVCSQKMKEVSIGKPGINVDVCSRANGLWFDSGEVDELLKQLHEKSAGVSGSEQPVFEFLGEIFKAKNE